MTFPSSRLNLMLIASDPAFRQWFSDRVVQPPDLQLRLEADSTSMARRLLQQWSQPEPESTEAVPLDLIVLDLDLPGDAIAFCQELGRQHPGLPILTTSQVANPALITAVFQAGAMGYCQQNTASEDWLQAMQQVAAGYSFWAQGMESIAQSLVVSPSGEQTRPVTGFGRLRQRMQLSGLSQIDRAIARINAQLDDPTLTLLDQLVLTGQRRELYTSRWVVNRLLGGANSGRQRTVIPTALDSQETSISSPPVIPPPLQNDRPQPMPNDSSLVSAPSSTAIQGIQAALFDTTFAKIQFNLRNLTDTPLEIDILREDRKRELLTRVLQQLEDILAELRFSQIDVTQLADKTPMILNDLWQATVLDFFGRYTTLPLGDSPTDRLIETPIEIAEVLLQDRAIVQTEILDKIPMMTDFLAHLLLQVPLMVDETGYAVGTVEAMSRMEALLQNLVIQVGNAVVQPLLNRFGNVVAVKQQFYDRRLLSTREIERFRNDLSWKYRMQRYFKEPTAIFESRYSLFILSELGIVKASIYSPRSQELDDLAGIGLAVTIALEARDAIAPRLRSAISFVGSGVVYVLTEVIGRGIGLIGRGIIKGVGNVMQDPKFSRSSQKGRGMGSRESGVDR